MDLKGKDVGFAWTSLLIEAFLIVVSTGNFIAYFLLALYLFLESLEFPHLTALCANAMCVKQQTDNFCLCLINFRFCFECIDNWSSIMNLCPLCQREFQLITCVPVRILISVPFFIS